MVYRVHHPPALMCLLIGTVGIAATLVQLALIKPLESVFANAEGINFTQNIENKITNAIWYRQRGVRSGRQQPVV